MIYIYHIIYIISIESVMIWAVVPVVCCVSIKRIILNGVHVVFGWLKQQRSEAPSIMVS